MILSFGSIATAVSSYVLNEAKSYLKDVAKDKLKELLKSDFSEYEKELASIINDAMQAYARDFPRIDQDKTYFFQSQVLLTELLKFRLNCKLNKDAILKSIENDDRIVLPELHEVEKFLGYFDNELNKSNKINKLFIESNYKNEIFGLQKALQDLATELPDVIRKEFNEFKKEIKSSFSQNLVSEWAKQVDEIRDYLFDFKPVTSLNLLVNLEKRINESGGFEDKLLKARITYLKAVCKNEIALREEEKKEMAQLFIVASMLSPFNKDYKHNATLSYYVLADVQTAYAMGEELLREDPFDTTGWIMRCYSNKKAFEEFYTKVPQTIKDNAIFKVNIFNWFLSTKIDVPLSKIDQLKLGFPIDALEIPAKISLLNREYWLSVCDYLFGKFIEETQTSRVVALLDQAQKTDTLTICNKILSIIYGHLNNSEVSGKFFFYFFEYFYTEYLLHGGVDNVRKMEEYYLQLKDKNPVIVFAMAKSYASANTKDDIFKAIKCLEDFDDKEIEDLFLLKSIYLSWVGKDNESLESLKKYIEFREVITEKEVFNLLNLAFQNSRRQREQFSRFVRSILSKTFDPPHLKGLLNLLFPNNENAKLSKEEIIGEIKEISEFLEREPSLRYFIGLAYFRNDLEDSAITYLHEYIDFDIPSPDLKLYCEAMFKSVTANKVELMPILEKWRMSFHPDYDLLCIELYLKESQSRWKDALEIAEFAYKKFNDEYSLNQIFISAVNDNLNKHKINEYANLIQNREIKNEDIAIQISEAIFRAGLPEVAIELMYKKAIEKQNIKTRQAYFQASAHYREDLFVTYDVVEEGRFVTYSIDSKVEVLHFTKEKANDPRYQNLMGKKASEIVKTKQPLSHSFVDIRIIRVVNKYLALLDEIIQEFGNPLNGYNVQVLKFDGNDPASISNTFIEQFGVESSLNIERIKENIEKYYCGKASFSEIAYSVFKYSLFDTYYYLTGFGATCFRALTTAWTHVPDSKENVFVLDATSLCLFFELARELEINFKQKFVITTFLKRELEYLISEIDTNSRSELSITVTKDAVIPHIKQPHESDEKINLYKNILAWIENNCEVVNVDERVNFASPAAENMVNQRFWNIQVDCRFLIDRPNFYLLTNDTFFITVYHCPPNKIISPCAYIEKYYDEYDEKVKKYLLDKKYIGIAIKHQTIIDEYLKFLKHQENRFNVCLENLNFAWNPDERNITEGILFLKKLFLMNQVSLQNKKQTTQSILLSLIDGMNFDQLNLVRNQIEKEFSLMGSTKNIVSLEFVSAMQIKTMQKRI